MSIPTRNASIIAAARKLGLVINRAASSTASPTPTSRSAAVAKSDLVQSTSVVNRIATAGRTSSATIPAQSAGRQRFVRSTVVLVTPVSPATSPEPPPAGSASQANPLSPHRARRDGYLLSNCLRAIQARPADRRRGSKTNYGAENAYALEAGSDGDFAWRAGTRRAGVSER